MKKISEQRVYEGHWLEVFETFYENKHGHKMTWESIKRKKCNIGVVILAKLIPSQRIIIIKQFRPAIDGYVLSLPAGLAFDDPNHALVELKEETGYKGKIVAMSPVLKTGSTLTNESGRIISIEVDEHDPANLNPVQELEPGEDITVYLLKKEEMLKFFESQLSEGVQVSSNLWYMFGLKGWLD